MVDGGVGDVAIEVVIASEVVTIVVVVVVVVIRAVVHGRRVVLWKEKFGNGGKDKVERWNGELDVRRIEKKRNGGKGGKGRKGEK